MIYNLQDSVYDFIKGLKKIKKNNTTKKNITIASKKKLPEEVEANIYGYLHKTVKGGSKSRKRRTMKNK